MKKYDDLVADALTRITEIMPWELETRLASGNPPLLLDVRERAEFMALHIPGSLNVPRGILEQSCEWDYDETAPELATGRNREIVVICRSGKRSALAADAMLRLGFTRIASLRLGIRGWNDSELALVDADGNAVDADAGDVLLAPRVRQEQRRPK